MKTILINGDFFCRTLTGIERYAFELTTRLDKLCVSGEIALIVPANAPTLPDFKNIRVIRHKTAIKSHLYWQMITLQLYLILHQEYTVLEFGNTCLPFSPGIVFLHDIYCELFAEDFSSNKEKLIRLYNRWQYRLIAKKAKQIITVSQFSKKQIAQTYRVPEDRIQIISNGWEHFQTIMPDTSIFNSHPQLKQRQFYFILGSLSKRKNIQWILQYAAAHPNDIFAVSGKSLPTLTIDSQLIDASKLTNVILLGYISDQQVKALMQSCKAYIQPSYYEGFGIPPLEALSCGVPVIVANAASLPEVYGNSVHYIDPFNANTDLDGLLQQPVDPPDRILQKYTYDTAAGKLYDLIQTYRTYQI